MKEGIEIISKSAAEMPPRKTPQQGCATTLRAAIDPNLTGKGSQPYHDGIFVDRDVVDKSIFLSDAQVTSSPKLVASYSLDQTNADRVWNLSEKIVGERFRY